MSLAVAIIGGAIFGGATLLFGKGAALAQAGEDITYEMKVNKMRVHKVSLSSVEVRFSVDLKLINPSQEEFVIMSPDIFIKYKGEEIGRNKIANRKFKLKARNEVTIPNIEFKVNIYKIISGNTALITSLISSWKLSKSFAENVTSATVVLSAYQTEILQKMSAKIKLNINDFPIVFENTLGYAPVSAIQRPIEDGSRFDKYFPLPKGKKTLLKKGATIPETVEFMIDIVNKDAHLIKKFSELFRADSVKETARKIFDFIYKYIKYDLEEGEQLRNPLTTYHLGQRLARDDFKKHGKYLQKDSADCDDMSIFVASILHNLGIEYQFRIASYPDKLGIDRGYSHVYTLISPQGNSKMPIIIDPVYYIFNAEKQFSRQITFDMQKNQLNGTDVYYLNGVETDINEALDVLSGTSILSGETTDSDILDYIIKSRNQIAENPEAITSIDPNKLVEMYDYAISYWNTPQRDQALKQLEAVEEQLITNGFLPASGMQGYEGLGFFGELGELGSWLSRTFKKGVEMAKHNKDKIRNLVRKNYAKKPAEHVQKTRTPAIPQTGMIKAEKPNNTWNTFKAFVAKNKYPLAAGSAVFIGGTIFLIGESVKKNKAKNSKK